MTATYSVKHPQMTEERRKELVKVVSQIVGKDTRGHP